MISNSILSRGATFLNAPASTPGQMGTTHSTVYLVSEYFVSATQPAAKSEVDYLVSPVEQIRTHINTWLSRFGSQTRIETEDATWLVAPRFQISEEFFESYESVFKAVMLYRAHVGQWQSGEPDVPSEAQMNAALLGLANLVAALAPAPSPMLLEDGTIGAYWRRGQCYASIDFEVDGEHSWAGTDGKQFHSGTWKIPGQLPPELMNELLSIGN